MTSFGSFAAPSFWLPGNFQTIAPVTNWGTQITVNYQGNAAIERDVQSEVASFGKQLGIVTEAVLALAGPLTGALDADADAKEKVVRLATLAARVDAVKARHGAAIETQIREQVQSLAATDRDAADRLLQTLRRELAESADPDDKPV